MAMYAVVVKGGKFTFTVDRDLAKGLRPSEKNPRNEEFLVECVGAVGREGVLCSLEPMTRLDTSVITDGFPFPQIFSFSHITLVCGSQTIYEWDGSTLNLVYTATEPGGPWDAVDFQSFIYLSNGRVAVERQHSDGSYVTSSLPTAVSMCNYSGQVMIAGPNMEEPGASLTLPNGTISLTLSMLGEISTT